MTHIAKLFKQNATKMGHASQTGLQQADARQRVLATIW